jgi:hypothetical protein
LLRKPQALSEQTSAFVSDFTFDLDQGAHCDLGSAWSPEKERSMPTEAVPFVLAILAFFGVFIVAVGGAQIWTGMPPHRKP